MVSKTVDVSILQDDGMCAVPIAFDPAAVFGKVRAPVKVTINGYTFHSTIARMGGQTFIPLRKSNRDAASVKGGDRVKVKIEFDPVERTVEARWYTEVKWNWSLNLRSFRCYSADCSWGPTEP